MNHVMLNGTLTRRRWRPGVTKGLERKNLRSKQKWIGAGILCQETGIFGQYALPFPEPWSILSIAHQSN